MDKRYLKARVGNMDQIAYARREVLSQGKADGLRIIDVDNGGGLVCTILEGRGLDIGSLKYKGVNIGFLGKPGFVAPALTSVHPGEFTKYFHGGMLYTCGLNNIGPATSDKNGEHPIHGRLSLTPASEVNTIVDWDTGNIRISGKIHLSALFGVDIVLSRLITIPLFGVEINITDTVVNQGFAATDIMFLYHFNFGWPFLSEDTKLEVTHENITPRDENAIKGQNSWNTFESPIDDYVEQVFYHTPIATDDDKAHAKVINDKLKLNAQISFDIAQLPQLIQWKSMGSGDYALGIEPATCRVGGLKTEDKAGRLISLAPEESKTFNVSLKITQN